MRQAVAAQNATVAVLDSHRQVEESVQRLGQSGFDLSKLSVVAMDRHPDEQVVAHYGAGGQARYWGEFGPFWTGMWASGRSLRMNKSGLSATETEVEIYLYGWNDEGGFWHGPTEIAPALNGTGSILRKLRNAPGTFHGKLHSSVPGLPGMDFQTTVYDLTDAGLAMVHLDGFPHAPIGVVAVIPAQRRVPTRNLRFTTTWRTFCERTRRPRWCLRWRGPSWIRTPAS